jgi:excinuclease UvrABC helicase subunit UvrB
LDPQNSKGFKFDYVFPESHDQQAIYDGCGIDNLVNKAIEGYHSTIFAYGQTGSGKTYTMQGG